MKPRTWLLQVVIWSMLAVVGLGPTVAAAAAVQPRESATPRDVSVRPTQKVAVDNIIYLKAKHSGKCMTVYQASLSEGAIVNQYRCLGHHNQWWVAYYLGNLLWRFVAYESQKCLTVQGGSTLNGAKLVQSTCVNGNNQMFAWSSGGLMKAYHSGKCVGVSGASTADNAAIVQWSCSTFGDHGKWIRVD